MKISVIGAGNGGQAMAAHLTMMGHEVCLYDRDPLKLPFIKEIQLQGRLEGNAKITKVTDNLQEALYFSEVIMITTTATAHADLAEKMAPFLKENQIVILNPGRTGGVWEFRNILKRTGFNKLIHLAEAQTLIYASRIIKNGLVNVIGIKDHVLLAGESKEETEYILNRINPVYPCFKGAESLLHTGLENIGCIFHPCVILCNAATIERGEKFYFYRDMTPQVSEFIQKVDQERLEVGKAYGINLQSASDWIVHSYSGVKGDTLCERMKNNPAYYDIIAPSSIYTRQLSEDIPTGLLPISELGKLKGVETPLMDSIINISNVLLGVDFRKNGRTLSRLDLNLN